MAKWLQVEVAAALPERQVLVPLTLAEGMTVQDAIDAAELASRLPGFEYDKARVGVFGRLCRPDRALADGDRVELYRPLKADPKEVRRQLAELERGGKNSP
ncbi:MAG: RnfH family protein [Wenzhouxiangella sp.]